MNENIESYLHHRDPYLLVDQILNWDENEITTQKRIRGDEFFLKGHFPKAPVVPGAMLQEMTTQSAGAWIAKFKNPMKFFNTNNPDSNEYALGVLARVYSSKFKGLVRPHDELIIQVKLLAHMGDLFKFQGKVFRVDHGEKTLVMENQFGLTNISTPQFTGMKH
jgi:3-hydroxyacyl-[acyl-carrier-protein] dehydratase